MIPGLVEDHYSVHANGDMSVQSNSRANAWFHLEGELFATYQSVGAGINGDSKHLTALQQVVWVGP